MAQENVEIVVRALEVSRTDPASFLTSCDPEIEWDESRMMPEPRVYHGHEGVRQFWRRWTGTWDEYGFAIEEAIDAGHEEVVVRARVWGRGRGSGVPVELRFGQVFTVRNGRIVRFRAFPDFEQALEAVGLSE